MKQAQRKSKELRTKMIEHLEPAIAVADAAGDCATSYLIETAMDSARADQWPTLDPEVRVALQTIYPRFQ